MIGIEQSKGPHLVVRSYSLGQELEAHQENALHRPKYHIEAYCKQIVQLFFYL